MIINIIINQGRKIIAICDSNLLGQKFENEKLQLDLSSKFYSGEEKNEEEILSLAKDFFTINAVGKKSVDFIAKELNIDKDSIKEIEGVPFLNIFRV